MTKEKELKLTIKQEAFARAHGVVIEPAKLYAGERIRRCPTVNHPKKENGAYFWDGQRGIWGVRI